MLTLFLDSAVAATGPLSLPSSFVAHAAKRRSPLSLPIALLNTRCAGTSHRTPSHLPHRRVIHRGSITRRALTGQHSILVLALSSTKRPSFDFVCCTIRWSLLATSPSGYTSSYCVIALLYKEHRVIRARRSGTHSSLASPVSRKPHAKHPYILASDQLLCLSLWHSKSQNRCLRQRIVVQTHTSPFHLPCRLVLPLPLSGILRNHGL